MGFKIIAEGRSFVASQYYIYNCNYANYNMYNDYDAETTDKKRF